MLTGRQKYALICIDLLPSFKLLKILFCSFFKARSHKTSSHKIVDQQKFNEICSVNLSLNRVDQLFGNQQKFALFVHDRLSEEPSAI